MRSLLDHDVLHSLRDRLPEEHEVITAQCQQCQGGDYDDSELLSLSERHFDVFVTLDTDLAHQQQVGIVVIDVHPIVSKRLEQHIGKVNSALSAAAEEQKVVVVREDGNDVLPI